MTRYIDTKSERVEQSIRASVGRRSPPRLHQKSQKSHFQKEFSSDIAKTPKSRNITQSMPFIDDNAVTTNKKSSKSPEIAQNVQTSKFVKKGSAQITDGSRPALTLNKDRNGLDGGNGGASGPRNPGIGIPGEGRYMSSTGGKDEPVVYYYAQPSGRSSRSLQNMTVYETLDNENDVSILENSEFLRELNLSRGANELGLGGLKTQKSNRSQKIDENDKKIENEKNSKIEDLAPKKANRLTKDNEEGLEAPGNLQTNLFKKKKGSEVADSKPQKNDSFVSAAGTERLGSLKSIYSNSYISLNDSNLLERGSEAKDKNRRKKRRRRTENIDVTDQLGILSLERLTELNHKLHNNKKRSKELHPHIKQYLKKEAFQRFPVTSNDLFRKELPVPNPEVKVDIVSLVKKFIGKDITKVSLPAALNMPVNALMTLGEMMTFKSALDMTVTEEDPLLRLGLSMVPLFFNCSLMRGERNKPFNPFCGETHEMFWEDLRILGEQISQHPPVSAVYVETKNYTFECKLLSFFSKFPKFSNFSEFFRIFEKFSIFLFLRKFVCFFYHSNFWELPRPLSMFRI